MEGQGPPARAWRIESVGENFKVVFMHNGNAYELGLFSTREEGTRVADVLTIKEAVDAGQDLNTLRLEYPLDRYGVDNNTAHEIRSVSFNQVVRDLQCCCVEQLVPDGTVPGWTTELPSTHYRSMGEREYRDAVSQGTALTAPSQQQLAAVLAEEEAEAGQQAQQQPEAAAPLSAKGLPQLPPRPVSRGSGGAPPAPKATAQAQTEGPSAVTNVYQAAGKANADAAAAAAAASMPAPPPRPPLSQRTGLVGGITSPRAQHAINVVGAGVQLQPAPLAQALAPPPAQQLGAPAQAAEDSGAQGGLVLRVPPNMRPIRHQFRGITQAGRKWRCQTHIAGRNVGLVAGTTQMEAALMYDLLMIWKHFADGKDPSGGDYNYSFHDIAKDTALLNLLRECSTSDMATQVLSGLVSQGAVARVFGLPVEPPGHKVSKAEQAARLAASSGKKMHWRTKQRLEREQQERSAAGAAAGYPGVANMPPAEEGLEEDGFGEEGGHEEGLEEDELFGEEEDDEEGRPRKKKKKMHWRTVQRLERERLEREAAAAAGLAPADTALVSPGGGKKLHWRTLKKLERLEREAAAAGEPYEAALHVGAEGLGSGEQAAGAVIWELQAQPSQPVPQQQQYQQAPSAAVVAAAGAVVEEGVSPVNGRAVLSYRYNSHPFHGLSVTTQKDRDTGDTLLHAQFSIYYDAAGRLTLHSTPDKKIVHSCPCRTPAEAAVAWDIGHLWKTIQVGEDPAVISPREGSKTSRRCNFGRSRYLNDMHLMQQIRACRDYRMLQDLWKELNKAGKLRQLAIMGPGPAALAQARQQQQAAASGEAGPSGEAAAAGAKRPALAVELDAMPPPMQHRAGLVPSPARQRQEPRQDGALADHAAVPIQVVPSAGAALYEPREEVRIQAIEQHYYSVRRMLEGLGTALSKSDLTRFLSYYIRHRDMWRVQHDEIKRLLEAGEQGQVVRFVHEALGIEEHRQQQQQQFGF